MEHQHIIPDKVQRMLMVISNLFQKLPPPPLDTPIFSYSCTTLVFADGTCPYASFFTPRTHVCCQQGVDGKLISKKC